MRNMGGLRHAMPFTWILMWIATLAISGIPLFAGFFSKDEILGTVFDRARRTRRCATRTGWAFPVGRCCTCVYGVMLARRVPDGDLHDAHDALHLSRPQPDGRRRAPFLHEAPWIMTGPLVVLGMLSAAGGFLNLPPFFPIFGAPIDVLKTGSIRSSARPSFARRTAWSWRPPPSLGVTLGVVAGERAACSASSWRFFGSRRRTLATPCPSPPSSACSSTGTMWMSLRPDLRAADRGAVADRPVEGGRRDDRRRRQRPRLARSRRQPRGRRDAVGPGRHVRVGAGARCSRRSWSILALSLRMMPTDL